MLGHTYNFFCTLLDSVSYDFVEDFCMCVHEGHWSVVVVSFSDFGISVILASEWVREYFLCFCHLKEIVENWYNFFFMCLVEFTNEPVWLWCFLFCKVISYWCNFFNWYRLFRLLVSFCVRFGRLCLPENWSITSRSSNLWA